MRCADRTRTRCPRMADLSRADRFCRSLLGEASARLAAIEKDRPGQAVSDMEEIIPGCRDHHRTWKR